MGILFALLTPGAWVTGLLKLKDLLVSLVKWVIELVVKYPKETLVIIALVIAGYFLYEHAYKEGYSDREEVDKKTIAELRAKVENYEEQIRQQNIKIAKLEGDSKETANKNAWEIKILNEKLGVMVTNYKLAVADVVKWKSKYNNRQVIYIEREGKPIEVRVQDGKVVCDRFYDEYVNTINTIVDETNRALKGDK